MFRLPNLIFAELHEDPATAQTLNNILPELTQLGYDTFLDEIPSFINKAKWISIMKEQEKEYEFIQSHVNEWNELINARFKNRLPQIDLTIFDNPLANEEQKAEQLIAITGCVMGQRSIFPTIATLTGMVMNLEMNPQLIQVAYGLHFQLNREILARHQSRLLWLSLLENLPDNINYQPIDQALGLAFTSEGLEKEIKKTSRDDKMSHAYFNATSPAFGRIGLLHAKGIQQRAIDAYASSRVANTQLCCFHLYTRPPLNLGDDRSPGSLQVKELERDARAGGLDHPLKIVAIDITNKNTNEIIQLISAEVENRKKEFAALAPEIKAEAVSDLADYMAIRTKEKNKETMDHSIFSSVKKMGVKASEHITKMSSKVKISAAEKLIILLTGSDEAKAKVIFSPEEMMAINDKRLGEITKKLIFFKILPEELIKMEPAILSKGKIK